jgi:hypothetical protein
VAAVVMPCLCGFYGIYAVICCVGYGAWLDFLCGGQMPAKKQTYYNNGIKIP